jgi:hypothetical protein
MRIAAAANVLVPAILLLEERGYVLTATRAENVESWAARRGDVELVGGDPIELLALASLAEARGASWRASDDLIHATLKRFRIA